MVRNGRQAWWYEECFGLDYKFRKVTERQAGRGVAGRVKQSTGTAWQERPG